MNTSKNVYKFTTHTNNAKIAVGSGKINHLLFQLIVVSLSHKLINKKHQSKTLCLLLT